MNSNNLLKCSLLVLVVALVRVRQVEAKAIRKLQHPVRSRKLEGFLDHKTV